MKAVTKTRPSPGKEWKHGLDLLDMPEPVLPDDNHLLIEVTAAAICGTDVGIYTSKDSLKEEMRDAEFDPVIIGHEFAGRVLDAGKGALEFLKNKLGAESGGDLKKSLRENYNVTAEMHITCGTCLQCRIEERHVCKNTRIKGLHLHGAFAKFMSIPAENLVLVPKGEIPVEVMAFMDAIGNAVHTVSRMDVRGKRIAILGCGVQGLMATAIAHQLGAEKIFVTDTSHPKRGITTNKLEEMHFSVARSFGANACFDMAVRENRQKFVAHVMDETEGIGVDGVLEMSGNYKAYEDAFKVVRAGGVFSLLGLPSGDYALDFAKEIIFKGLTVNGIIGRRVWDTWNEMLDLLKAGLSDTFVKNNFVTHDLPLENYNTGFEEIFAGNALKVIFRP